MDAKPRNLGGSLPVPNVQDLAARPGDELTPPVLSRYLRDDVDGADANGDAASSVPVIDLARLLDPSSHGDEESAKLKAACEEWGFFQVINHGVPDAVVADVKADLQAFFRLPLADKRAVAQEPGGIEGYGQAFVVSEDQKLDWADMLFLSTQPPEYRAPRFWPARPATFGDSLARYSAEVQRVAARLLASMAANLGVADAARLARVADAQAVRVNYYPACPHGRGRVLGLSPHSDAAGLTLLLQVSAVPGLQIRRRGAWISVDPIPGALVANVGDVVEVLTNGRYKSIEHRALVSPTHHRVSVAAFHSARFGDTYAPLEETMVDGDEPARYRSIGVEDYVRLVLSSKLQGKNIMDAMKINPVTE